MLIIFITAALLIALVRGHMSQHPLDRRGRPLRPYVLAIGFGAILAMVGMLIVPRESETTEERMPMIALEPVQSANGPTYLATVRDQAGAERLVQVPGSVPVTRTEAGTEGVLLQRTTLTQVDPTARWWLYLPFTDPGVASQSEVLEVQVPESMGAPVGAEGRQP